MPIISDYLALSSRVDNLETLIQKFGLENLDFVAIKPRYGWSDCLYCDGIRIMYGGREDVYIEMSGSGCRTLETENPDWDWYVFFYDCFELNKGQYNCSRIDLAFDDREDLLNLDKLISYTSKGRYKSKFRSRRWISGDEQSIIWGSPKSSTRLRIYNKALERGTDGHWIRLEFQLRDECAMNFIKNYLYSNDLGSVYFSMMRDYLIYTTIKPDKENKNQDRARITKWWLNFLAQEKYIKRFVLEDRQYNALQFKLNFYKHNLSSVRAFYELEGEEELLRLISETKPNRKQEIMLSAERRYQLSRLAKTLLVAVHE